ncbi:oxygen-binding di-iron domain-containing protein [Thermovibrio sp.]
MLDLSKPVEIAPEVFWVGYYIPNDPFQCHVYLVRNGEESILIDPGSMITFPVVLEKIYSLIPLRKIKYVIFHHQDPDITGCYSVLEELFPDKKERFIVTHWRTKTLLKHYRWKTSIYLIDRHDFKLKAGDRELEFVFTPYAHFPGAFCTFDKKTKTLFSSDIFSAISDNFFFYAQDRPEYYEGVELFHKHYMPSNAILNYALDKIMEKRPELIAPQHGSIIKREMILPVVNRLRRLECGLYLLDEKASNIKLLSRADAILKRLTKSIIAHSDFKVILKELFKTIKGEIPELQKVILITDKFGKNDKKLTFEVDEREVKEYLTNKNKAFLSYTFKEHLETEKGKAAELYIYAEKPLKREQLKFLEVLFKNAKYAISATLERELEILTLKEKVIKDPLTGLYNRNYIESCLSECNNKIENFIVAVLDIDFFKKVNDTYGHDVGDCVLKEVAKLLKENFRKEDCIVRFGGEEFLVIMKECPFEAACKKMEKIRKRVEEREFCKEKGLNLKITVSIGVCQFKSVNDFETAFKRADEKLYEAKRKGRNKVVY